MSPPGQPPIGWAKLSPVEGPSRLAALLCSLQGCELQAQTHSSKQRVEDPSITTERLLDQDVVPPMSNEDESGWDKLLDDDEDTAMDVEPDGYDDEDVFLLDV